MANPVFLSKGPTPQRTDTVNTLLKRIAGGVLDNSGGGGGGGGTIDDSTVWSAAGPPAHTPTVDNQIYTDNLTGGQWYWYDNSWFH